MQLSCISIGNWAYSGSSSLGLCLEPQTIPLYTDSGSYSIGSLVSSGCPLSGYVIESGFYSNGVDILTVNTNLSGDSEVQSVTSCTPSPTETMTPTPTPTPTVTPTFTSTPTVTPTNTLTPTVTPTNTTTPTLTPTATPNYNYYFTGCCGGETYRINSGTPLSILPGDFVRLSISGGNIDNCFEVVNNIPISDITYTWNPGGGDAFYDYDSCFDCLTANTVSCGGAVLITSCESPTTYIVNYNTTLPSIGSVFYMTFTGSTPSGCYTVTSSLVSGPIDGVAIKTPFIDCPTCLASVTTPTPTTTASQTPTPTETPTNTPTNTQTPTVTPTPTNTKTPTVTPTITPTNTKTPTVTPTVTPTKTTTPTFTPSPSTTPSSNYCIQNTITYDGNYMFGGSYAGNNYYYNTTLYVGFIFYSIPESRWCLAANLGDSCVEFGPYGSTSVVPDLDDTVMYIGTCVTTTTTTNPCATFDFDAIFDCYIPPTPSNTATPTVTPTVTITPSASELCGGRSMTVTLNNVTPSATSTPTPTPSNTPQITRPCNYSGEVIFNTVNEIIQCANSKKFKDCFTGIDYFTSDMVLVSGTTSPKEGYVYNATINGLSYCVVFEGLFENISGVDNIVLTNEVGPSNLGSCLDCNPVQPEPILECIVVNSECGNSYAITGPYINGKLSYTWTFSSYNQYLYNIYWDNINNRWNATETTTNVLGAYLEIDSQLPVGTTSEWITVSSTNPSVDCFDSNFNTTLLNVPCPTLTPTPTPTPSPTPCVQFQYRITNLSPSKVSAQYTSCNIKGIQSVSLAGNTSVVICSSTTPTSNNPQNVTITPLGFSC